MMLLFVVFALFWCWIVIISRISRLELGYKIECHLNLHVCSIFGPEYSSCDAGDGPYRDSRNQTRNLSAFLERRRQELGHLQERQGSNVVNAVVPNNDMNYNELPNCVPASREDRRKFEHSIPLARQVFWGNSGCFNFFSLDEVDIRTDSTPTEIGVWEEKILAQKVSLLDKQKLHDAYRKDIKKNEPLHTCGVCGYRDYESALPVNKKSLDQLSILKMSSVQYQRYMSVQEEYRVCFGVTEWRSEIYYIIPFFVERVNPLDSLEIPTVPVCRSCEKCIKKGKLPPFSMAVENYGTPQSHPELGMECFKLSATSKNMLFLVRGYNQIVELSTVNGKPHVIRGSMIHFDNESIVAQDQPVSLLPRGNAEEFIQLHLLGDRGRIDIIKKSLGGQMKSPIRVNATYNMKLLLAIQACNPHYSVVNIMSSHDGIATQENTLEQIIRRAVIDPDPITQHTSDSASSSTTIPDNQEFVIGLDETIMYKRELPPDRSECSRTKFLGTALRLFKCVTPIDRNSSNDENGETSEDIHNRNGEVSSSSSSSSSSFSSSSSSSSSFSSSSSTLGDVTRLSRSSKPLNEFDHDELQRLFAGRFSDLFFLGEVFVGMKGTPSRKKIDHLLHFYDNRFCCNEFVFFLADMLERHEIANQCKGKLMNSPESVDFINCNFRDGAFLEKLEVAIHNPEGSDAKLLFRKLETILKVTSGTIEFSPAARIALLQVMYSQMYLYNLPSWFNTYSPDDNYDILTIRRALVDKRVSKDENGFKDSEVDEIYECLQKGGEGRIHCSELVTSNGVAAAMTFERRKQARAKHLLGVDLGARKTTVVEDKLKGIFGVVYNIQSVLEVQARQALHEHYLLWSSLFPPWFLEKCAEHPVLVAAIAQVLDSMVQAKLSIESIEKRILRRVKLPVTNPPTLWKDLYDVAFMPEPTKLVRPSLFFGEGPMPGLLYNEEKEKEYWNQCYDAHAFSGYHDEHSLTCHKGVNGQRSCRLGYCQCANDFGTRCIQIEVTETIKEKNGRMVPLYDVEKVDIEVPIPPLCKLPLWEVGNDVRCPFPIGDERLLIWSLSRPSWLKPGQIGHVYTSDTIFDDRQKVYPRKVLWDQNVNGYVVPFNDLLTYLDGCNTAIYNLGSTEAAKVSTYYMTNYVVKENGAFKKLLSVAKTAHNLTTDFPNIYFGDDDNSTGRNNEIMNSPTLHGRIHVREIVGESTHLLNQSRNQHLPSNLSLEEYNSVKRFGNTLLNSLRSTYERSSQESASKILFYPASYSSTKNWYLFMKSAMKRSLDAARIVDEALINNFWVSSVPLNNEGDDSSIASMDSCQSDQVDVFLKECVLDNRDAEMNDDVYGDPVTAVEYLDVYPTSSNNRCSITVSDQYEFYRYRSDEAVYLSFYEYFAICSVVPKKVQKQTANVSVEDNDDVDLNVMDVLDVDGVVNVENESDVEVDEDVDMDVDEEQVFRDTIRTSGSQVNKGKRPDNLTLSLHSRHPLYGTHVEKVRSKQLLPVVTRRIPRLLLDRSDKDSDLKDEIALFYLTLFCPIDRDTGLFIATWSDDGSKRLVKEPNWDSFIFFIRHLSKKERTYSQKGILQCILNMNAGLESSHKKKQVFLKMNYKGTLPWDELAKQNSNMSENRHAAREENPRRVPPEYAYKAKAEEKYDNNDSRGGLRSDDNDVYDMNYENIQRLTDDLLMRSYNIAISDERRHRKEATQKEMNDFLVEMMDKIYQGFSDHIRNHSSSSIFQLDVDWRSRVHSINILNRELLDKVVVQSKSMICDEVVEEEGEISPSSQQASIRAEHTSPCTLEIGDEPAEGIGGDLPEEFPNDEQSVVIDLYYKRARARINHAMDPINHAYPNGQLLTYLDCGPGAGKTWLSQELFRRVNLYAKRVGYTDVTKSTGFFPTGTTGTACVTLNYGCVTVHSGFFFGKITKKKDEINEKLHQVKVEQRAKLSNQFGRQVITCGVDTFVNALSVDEVFMLVTIHLGHLDQRCREITGIEADFGGLDVHLQGDSMQFSAVGENLYDGAMIDLLPYELNRPLPQSPKDIGRKLFRKFIRIDSLKKLPRSEGCDTLKAILKQLSDRSIQYPVDDSLLAELKELTVNDLVNDPMFLESYITVGTNQERLCLNLSHSKAFALHKKLPLVRWKKTITGRKVVAELKNKPMLLKALYEHVVHEEELYQYFVEDISAILLSNINTHRGLANGTEVTLYGLWFEDIDDQTEYEELRQATDCGCICTIPKCPDAVLVEISPETAAEWESGTKKCTVVDGKYVIPLLMDHSSSIKYIPDGGSNPLHVGYVQFPFELGGVRTGHKMQGATRKRLICNFNPRCSWMNTHLDLRSLFVSISRVKSIEHIRIVPMIDGDRTKLDFMKKFSMDPKVRLLPRCYNEKGEWVATTDDIVKWFDELGIDWRPKATRKHPLNDTQISINERYPRPHNERGNVLSSRKRSGPVSNNEGYRRKQGPRIK